MSEMIERHVHLCPQGRLDGNVHRQHEWGCLRPDCKGGDVMECGIVADWKDELRRKAKRRPKQIKLKSLKKKVRAFVDAHYSLENILQTIDHIRCGDMSFSSCCCLISIPTADHKLAKRGSMAFVEPHYEAAQKLRGAPRAESAYFRLGFDDPGFISLAVGDDLVATDARRNRRLLPILLATLKRRREMAAVKITEIRRDRFKV